MSDAAVIPLPQRRLEGVNVLLEGPTGTGKTHAIGTLVDWGATQSPPLEVFVLFVEQGLETLLGYWSDHGKPIPANLRWRALNLKPLGLSSLQQAATMVGQLTYQQVAAMIDPNRASNNAFLGVLNACADFQDDRTGLKHGAVDSWKSDRVFVIDSLSELANACMKMVIGNKPTAAQPDYGVAQNNLMNFLRLLTQGCPCHFVMTAHVSREKNEITGGVKLMTKAIGTAIAGDIPPLFSDVIYTIREGTNFYWDTSTSEVDVKTRNLPIAAKLPPTFSVILDKWKNRAKQA